jgi:YHS domain-containing protein
MALYSQPPPQPYIAKAPTKAVTKPAAPKRIVVPWRACDPCGYSKVDNQPIARAKWQIEVPGGTLYFCNHHYRQYEFTFVERHFAVYDISEKVAPG